MKIEKAVHKIKKKLGVGREREEGRQKGGRWREGWKERGCPWEWDPRCRSSLEEVA